jgi:hypothetical protein
MKRKFVKIAGLICLLAGTSSALAATIGGYIGLAGGRSTARVPSTTPFNYFGLPGGGDTTKTTVGWAERGFIGWNFTPYFGLEGGYTNYARAIYNGRTPTQFSQLKYTFRGYDLVGKVYFPLGYTGANIYALAGAVRITETLNYTDGGIPLSGIIAQPQPDPGVSHGYNTRPLYGVGANVTLYKHLTFDFEVTQATSVGNFSANSNAIPFLTMGTIGIAYNF